MLILDFNEALVQATRVDGSIIVIQSGNHEFIAIRHRTSQTLYISNLIEPHTCKQPSYGKLHVGIYIAALTDALDREGQGHDTQPPSDGDDGPSGSGGNKQNGPSSSGGNKQDGPSGSGGHRGSHGGGQKGSHKDESEGSKKSKEGEYRGGNTYKKMAVAAAKVCFV